MNFDLIRLFLALVVMLGHVGIKMDGSWTPFLSGQFAVEAFFCISGFLITKSYIESDNLGDYCKKRLSRIYPPILLTFLIMLCYALLSKASLVYILSIANLLIFQDLLALDSYGIYGHGTFWTLVVEAQFYIFLPIILFCLQRNPKITWPVLAFLFQIGLIFAEKIGDFWSNKEIIYAVIFRESIFTYFHFFIAGITANFLFSYLRKAKRENLMFAEVGILSLSLLIFYQKNYIYAPFSAYFYPFALSFLIIYLAKFLAIFGKKCFFGDISYGIYIYHFPMITILTWLNLNTSYHVILSTILLSLLSWHLMEKKFIKLAHKKSPLSFKESGLLF